MIKPLDLSRLGTELRAARDGYFLICISYKVSAKEQDFHRWYVRISEEGNCFLVEASLAPTASERKGWILWPETESASTAIANVLKARGGDQRDVTVRILADGTEMP